MKKICIAILLTLVLGGCEFGGMLNKGETKKDIDLVGGSIITFHAVEKDANGNKITDIVPTAEEMNSLKTVFESRLLAEGYSDARISSNGDGQITVEIPELDDADEVSELLGTTAKLTFNDADGNVILDNTDLKSASYEYGATDIGGAGTHHVKIEFTPEARQKFADATRAAAARASEGKNYIAIIKDGYEITRPSVAKEIDDDSCVITGQFTAESAKMLATQIQSDALPVDLEVVSVGKVSPGGLE